MGPFTCEITKNSISCAGAIGEFLINGRPVLRLTQTMPLWWVAGVLSPGRSTRFRLVFAYPLTRHRQSIGLKSSALAPCAGPTSRPCDAIFADCVPRAAWWRFRRVRNVPARAYSHESYRHHFARGTHDFLCPNWRKKVVLRASA